MIRQPATAWLRIRQGRGRQADRSLALGWAAGFSLVSLFCLLGLFLLGRTALLGLAVPFAAILIAYLLAARSGRAAMRSLSMELAGAVGLALTAPAAYIAASGELTAVAAALWALMALQNAMGVLYVRQRPVGPRGRVRRGHDIGRVGLDASAGGRALRRLPGACAVGCARAASRAQRQALRLHRGRCRAAGRRADRRRLPALIACEDAPRVGAG